MNNSEEKLEVLRVSVKDMTFEEIVKELMCGMKEQNWLAIHGE